MILKRKHSAVSATLAGIVVCAALGASHTAMAQQGGSGGIYTCVDANGRRLTSDRPIMECLDREQRQLSGTGALKRVVPPSQTMAEQAAIAERERKANEERMRAQEQSKMLAALLRRYPTPASHAAARANATEDLKKRLSENQKRLQDTQRNRVSLEQELARGKPSSDKAAQLRSQVQYQKRGEAEIARFIVLQQKELAEINQRFDHEQAQLKPLWARSNEGR